MPIIGPLSDSQVDSLGWFNETHPIDAPSRIRSGPIRYDEMGGGYLPESGGDGNKWENA
jgi:hypothetical protein